MFLMALDWGFLLLFLDLPAEVLFLAVLRRLEPDVALDLLVVGRLGDLCENRASTGTS